MARRRRYRPRVRDASGAAVLASSGYGYSLAHWAGFLGLGLAAVLVLPLLLVALAAAPGALIGACWPSRWRVRWRKYRSARGLGRGHAGHIPLWMRASVYRADRYRCVHCRLPAGLQCDHVKPFACGGLTVLWNLVTLCGECNRLKSCYWQPWDGYDAIRTPILASERRARRSPARWLRMAWSL